MKHTQRAPIGKLIRVREKPDTTLSLIRAMKEPVKTISTYIFTNTITRYFAAILESVSTGRGQGFWITAEYGAGKTHFLAALAALFNNNSEEVWARVDDSQTKNYRSRLSNTRLFPVVLSLRGEAEVSGEQRSLLDVIEKAIQKALEDEGLENRVLVTTAEEICDWFNELSQPLKGTILTYIRDKAKVTPEEYVNEMGQEGLARLIQRFCSEASMSPRLTTSTKERISSVYNQLTQNADGLNYDGLLFIIDEFASWQLKHQGSPAQASDEELLETLAFLLPVDLGYRIHTIVASQLPPPVKLQGSAEGDRFINLPLLAGGSENEYDVIVARRIREIMPDMIPEINQYYEYYAHNFEFMKDIGSEASFRDIFPFQPRCFELLRRITARELPTARIGINVLHEVLDPNASHNKDAVNSILSRDQLVTAADLMLSPDLASGLKDASVYRDAYLACDTALANLTAVGLDQDQTELAKRIIRTLFLWHCASPETPRPMSERDLAEATLTTEGIVKPEDEIALILAGLRDLPQIGYSKERGAAFMAHHEGLSAPGVFDDARQRITDPYVIKAKWEESLCLSAAEAVGANALFSDLPLNVPKPLKYDVFKIEYTGEAILSKSWSSKFGGAIQKEDNHFRIVILREHTIIEPNEITNERIAVCIPGKLSEATIGATKDYMAMLDMEKSYEGKPGNEAEQIRDWIRGKKPQYIRGLINAQCQQYKEGKIYTKSQLSLDPKDIFSSPGNQSRFAVIANALIGNAYTSLPKSFGAFRKTFSSADAVKVLTGFFHSNPPPAAKSALDNFSVGLELARPDNLRKFSPVPPWIFDYLNQDLERNDGHLQTWQIYRDLSGPPYGLTYPLITLYLLCFVRYGSPAVDLYLMDSHTITLRNGNKPSQNKLSSATIPEIDWKTGIERYFDSLTFSTGPPWNEVVPYGRVLYTDLKTTIDHSEIQEQEQKLLDCLTSIKETIAQTSSNVELVAAKLGEDLEDDERNAISSVSDIVQATDFMGFHQAVTEKYDQPERFSADVSIYKRWDAFSKLSAEILDTKNWLDSVVLNESDQQLLTDHLALSNLIVLKTLLRAPSLWQSVKGSFDEFRRKFRNVYQAYHRDYYTDMTALKDNLGVLNTKLDALQRLNGIVELGKPVGIGLGETYQKLSDKVSTCPVASVTDVLIENQPFCSSCGLLLTTQPPSDPIDQLAKEADKALGQQLRRLSSEAIKQILAKSSEDRITRFLHIVQSSDLASLINVLDDEIIEFIRVLLLKNRVKTVAAPILERLAEKYAVIDEGQLEEAVNEFRRLLQESFKAAREKEPDKSIRVSLR